MTRKTLTSTLLSISLLTVSLSATGTNMVCKNGVCVVDISRLSSAHKREETSRVKPFAHQEREKSHAPVANVVETIVLPPEKYVMTPVEVEEYQMENLLVLPAEELGKTIIEKTDLPDSDYFCEDNKKPKVDKRTDTYECV